MPEKSLEGWWRVARSNIRYWAAEKGRTDLAGRFLKSLRSTVKQSDTIKNAESDFLKKLSGEAGQSVAEEIVNMIRDNVGAKRETIVAYFEDWKKDLERVKKLLSQHEYYLDAWLILSCYIGALAALRYPIPPESFDRAKYQYLLLKYSGKRTIYEKVDLLFFHQWDRSKYQGHRHYNSLRRHYGNLKGAVEAEFGTEADVQTNKNTRYVSPDRIVRRVLKHYKGLSSRELRKLLSLFSVSELLYRHVRNHAVHERRFPLVNKVYSGRSVRYEDNHIITGSFLFETTLNILNAIATECIESVQFPHELRQKRSWN